MIICIIQARMGSTRLPGKTMMDVEGNPLLYHVIQRIKKSKKINKLVIATTSNEEDNVIEEYCKKLNVNCFRGDSKNVLYRYYQCAKKYNSKIIVRVTADCPFIDASIVDELIEMFENNNYDLVTNNIPRTFPHGLDAEVFSFNSLEKAWKEATTEHDKEHVTPYIRNNPKLFKLANMPNPLGDYSHIRITTDYIEDIELTRKLYKEFFKKGLDHDFKLKDLIQFFEENPKLILNNK
jgi:spore coat polysaccharide biosynthesis protein SpsF